MADKFIRVSCSAFAGVDSPDKVPSEICLLKAGKNEYCDDSLLFDDVAAKSVMARYQKRGLTLKADYEHQSISVPPVIAPASAKKWIPEVRNGALFATGIEWTKKARQMIADGEYDYFSIVARVDPTSRRVVELVNFALTNTPAANGIEPLIAASITSKLESPMKTVIVALGLRAEAEEAEALAAVSALKDFEREVITIASAKDRASAIGVVTAMKAAVGEADKAKQELVALKQSTVDAECKRLLDEATVAGKLPPAKRADVEGMYSKFGIDAVKSMLSMLPVVATGAGEGPKAAVAKAVDDEVLTADEITIAKNVCGNPEELEKHLTNLRAYKRERAARAGR